MSGIVDSWAEESLSALERAQLRRVLEPIDGPQGPRLTVGGRAFVNFSSNDYLGLAAHPHVVDAARTALARHGYGAGASRLVVGDTDAHQSLERALARFEGTQAALLFNSGYAANVGVLSALLGPGDVVFSDALNHASLIDGCRLSRAQVVVYPHLDVEALESLVRAHPGTGDRPALGGQRLPGPRRPRRLVVTDTVFSMDGDRAPLKAIAEVCARHSLGLMVDEAHATGVLGATGRGLCELEDVVADVHVGTLSKALGGFGAYVCGSVALREVLLNKARSLVFSTALPAAACAAAEAALTELQDASRRAQLWSRVEQLAEGLRVKASSAVFSVVLGSPEAAMGASLRLREQGMLVKAIRPPTVPEGTSRLRIAVSAGHTEREIEQLINALRPVCPRAEASPSPRLSPRFAGSGSSS